MNLQDICTSYETSLRLKEAGFDADSGFVWLVSLYDPFYELQFWGSPTTENILRLEIGKPLKAYTFEQILKALPHEIENTENETRPYTLTWEYGHLGYQESGIYDDYDWFELDSLSEQAAAIWLWCKEKGHIK